MVPTLAVRSVDGRVGVRISHRTLSVAYRSWIRRRIPRVLKRGGVVGISYPARREQDNMVDLRSRGYMEDLDWLGCGGCRLPLIVF